MKYIQRSEFQELYKWFYEPEILVMLGPRQVGKTTLVNQFLDSLIKKNTLKEEQIIRFNLDVQQDRDRLQSQQYVLDLLDSSNQNTVVFIDEVQRLPEPGVFLKGVYDTAPEHKLIVTGSSSLEIKSKIADVLTGRKQVISLLPLASQEVMFKENGIEELLITGGYPKVFVTQGFDKKISRIEEIITSYLTKDISDFIGIELLEVYKKLLVLLADQLGEMVNISRLSNTLNVHFNTVERYLSVLQNTFFLDLVYPYSTKPSLEIVKSPLPYFYDLGIRNSLLNAFQPLTERQDGGKLFENLVYLELKRTLPKTLPIKYWRTKSQREVDFIVTNRIKTLPIEAKFKHLDKPIITTSMKAFIQMYEPKEFIVVNKQLESEKRWGSALIKYRTITTFLDDVTRFQW